METTPSSETRRATLRYLPGLDGLRAVSVLAVLVYHHYAVGGRENGWMPGGFLGVEVFFVVSGYLITSLLLAERNETGAVSFWHFYFRRARRLLPALWFLLAVVVAYSLLFLPDAIGHLRGDVVAALSYTSNWWLVLGHRGYAASVGRDALLKHLWSLAIEEQYYLLWPPLLVVGLRRWGRSRMLRVMVGVALASTVWMWILATGNVDRAYFGTDSRLSGLLAGSAFAFVYAPYRIRGQAGRGARALLDVGGLVGLYVLWRAFRDFHFGANDRAVFHGGFLLVDVATLLVIAAVVHPRSDGGRALGLRPLPWIGLRSYSLYLWHFPIFAITRPGGTSDGGDFEHLGHLHGWPVLVLRLALSFGAADLSYRYVERPVRSGAIRRYLERVSVARGASRTQLAWRGTTVATSCTLLAFVLGTGLAFAQPRTLDVGTGTENGAAPDSAAIAALRDAIEHPSTTTSTVVTSTAPPTSAAAPTTTAEPPPPPAVLAIGDSVMLGAKAALQQTVPGIVVDAVKSRQFGQAIDVLQAYAGQSLLPSVVVVHLGTNGDFTDAQFDQMMRVLGSRSVFFLTAREPRPWETSVNAHLQSGVARSPSAHLLDWRAYGGPHGDWFYSDGIHLTPAGRAGYADFVATHLRAGQ